MYFIHYDYLGTSQNNQASHEIDLRSESMIINNNEGKNRQL